MALPDTVVESIHKAANRAYYRALLEAFHQELRRLGINLVLNEGPKDSSFQFSGHEVNCLGIAIYRQKIKHVGPYTPDDKLDSWTREAICDGVTAIWVDIFRDGLINSGYTFEREACEPATNRTTIDFYEFVNQMNDAAEESQ